MGIVVGVVGVLCVCVSLYGVGVGPALNVNDFVFVFFFRRKKCLNYNANSNSDSLISNAGSCGFCVGTSAVTAIWTIVTGAAFPIEFFVGTLTSIAHMWWFILMRNVLECLNIKESMSRFFQGNLTLAWYLSRSRCCWSSSPFCTGNMKKICKNK